MNTPRSQNTVCLVFQESKDKYNLLKHVQRHLEEGKVFPCNFCGKESRSSSGLSQHIAKRHQAKERNMSEPEQKPSQSNVVIDEAERCDQQMEGDRMEETVLQIDINPEGKNNCVDNKPIEKKGDQNKNKAAAEAFKEKIEAMIEKVSLIERSKGAMIGNVLNLV